MSKSANIRTSPAHSPLAPTLPHLPALPSEIELKGDAVIVSDVHVPAVKRALVEQVIERGQRYGIKRLLVVGDLFNFDAFSTYPTLLAPPSLALEVKCARLVMDYWLSYFDEVFYTRGNHDARAIKATKTAIDTDIIKLLVSRDGEGLTVSLRDRVWLKSGNEQWLLCHQKEYSRQPLKVANLLSQKYRCNIVTTHEHHCATGISTYGGYMLACNPCMCEPSEIGYKNLETNTSPDWALGFGLIKDGEYITVLDRTPWRRIH